MSWYAIFVDTGYEEKFCRYIDTVKKQGAWQNWYKLMVPKRLIFERRQGIRKEVLKVMFPGYVLLETDDILEFFIKARNSPHIISFLRINSQFLKIREEEISQILALTNSDGLIGISKAFMMEDRVCITEGPLLGMEGIIKKIDKRKGRAKVKFVLNEKEILVDLGIEIMQRLEGKNCEEKHMV